MYAKAVLYPWNELPTRWHARPLRHRPLVHPSAAVARAFYRAAEGVAVLVVWLMLAALPNEAFAVSYSCDIPLSVVCQVSDPKGFIAVQVTLDTGLGQVTVVDQTFPTCRTSATVSWDPIVPNFDISATPCDGGKLKLSEPGSADLPGPIGIGDTRFANPSGAVARDEGSASTEVSLRPLALLDLGEGHSIAFMEDGDGVIVVNELVSLSDEPESPVLTDTFKADWEPLELYLLLTPEDRAIPSALLDATESERILDLARGRSVSKADLGRMPAAFVQLRKKDNDVFYRPDLCGNSGKENFQKLCDSNAHLGTNFCAPGLHPWHAKSSPGKVRHAAVMSVGCSSSVENVLKSKIGGVWHKNKFHIDATSYLMISRVWHKYSYKRYAGAFGYNQVASSFNTIRSWIGFW